MKRIFISILLFIVVFFSSLANESTLFNKCRNEVTVSYYNDKFHGRKTASGEIFDQKKYTAASNHYLIGTVLKLSRVVGEDTVSVKVKVNDRINPKYADRIDITKAAMKKLQGVKKGLVKVNVDVIEPTNML